MAAEITTAKAEKIGARHGEAYAREIARKAASGPLDRRRIGQDMQAHLEHQGRLYGAAGWSVEDAMTWARAFIASAEPILTPLAEGRPLSLPATGLAAMADQVRACMASPEAQAGLPSAANDAEPQPGWAGSDDSVVEDTPELREYFDAGVKDAVEHVFPDLGRRALGSSPAEIDAHLERRVSFTLANLRREVGASDDQAYLYRAGFLAACQAEQERLAASQEAAGGVSTGPSNAAAHDTAGDIVEVRLTLIFDSPEERARYYDLCPRVEGSGHWVQVGGHHADKVGVPQIMRGQLGFSDEVIERNIASACQRGEKRVREVHGRIGRDLVFCYRIGLRSRLRLAKDAFLAQLADAACREGEAHGLTAGRQLVEAARTRPELRPFLEGALIESAALASGTGRQVGLGDADVARWQAAFLGAAVPIVREAERSAPPRTNLALILPPSASAGSPARRPLRPEDFGALPSAPRP